MDIIENNWTKLKTVTKSRDLTHGKSMGYKAIFSPFLSGQAFGTQIGWGVIQE